MIDENDVDTNATALVRITYDAYSLVNPFYNPNAVPRESVFVDADKELYYEGEDIYYTITTENIADGTRLEYQLYGIYLSVYTTNRLHLNLLLLPK